MSVSSYLPAIISAAGAIGGAAMQANASQTAAGQQTAAGREALDFQREVLNRQQSNLQPYMDAGSASLGRLNTLMGGAGAGAGGSEMILVASPDGQQQMRPAYEAAHWQSLGATIGSGRTTTTRNWSGKGPVTTVQEPIGSSAPGSASGKPARSPLSPPASTGGGRGSSVGSTLLSILLPFLGAGRNRGGNNPAGGGGGGTSPTGIDDSLFRGGLGDPRDKYAEEVRGAELYRDYERTRLEGESFDEWYARTHGGGGDDEGGGT